MLGRGLTVKIIDYGLAWIKGEPKDRVQGTPEYMAPETATNKLVNERTDIYNFGAMMYRLVTFRLPPSAVPEGGLEVDKKTFKSMLKPVGELNPLAPQGAVRPDPPLPELRRPQAARADERGAGRPRPARRRGRGRGRPGRFGGVVRTARSTFLSFRYAVCIRHERPEIRRWPCIPTANTSSRCGCPT